MSHCFVFVNRIFLDSQSLSSSMSPVFQKDKYHSVNPEILQVQDKETGGKHMVEDVRRKTEKWQHESREMC